MAISMMMMTVLRDIALCILVESDRSFRGAYCLHHQGDESVIALMIEAVRTSDTSAHFYQNTRRNIPEDSHFHDKTA
jgi:hypothetical protein